MTEPQFDVDDLIGWWGNTTGADIKEMLPKLLEYGGSGPAVDLVDVGTFLYQMYGGAGTPSAETATELGIAFYLISKIARWKAALLEGERPSNDTLKDITVYSMMARRNRQAGGWPVGPGGPTP